MAESLEEIETELREARGDVERTEADLLKTAAAFDDPDAEIEEEALGDAARAFSRALAHCGLYERLAAKARATVEAEASRGKKGGAS